MTNSFHGTAFSINLNRQFWVYMPSKFSTRISSILDLCGLSSRLLDKEITETQMNESISYDKPNTVLQQERDVAYNFLAQALQ